MEADMIVKRSAGMN